MYLNDSQLKRKINLYKTNLIKKADKLGLYEDFGQLEVRKLKDQIDCTNLYHQQLIIYFEDWCMNYVNT